ncbi:HD-GYP domain-containing protein [Thermodesulfobacteriota bacterium]
MTNRKPTISIVGFHRRLVLQLAAVGLIVALLFGVSAWIRERNRVGDAIIIRALRGASAFNIYIDHLIESPGWPDKLAVQHSLEKFSVRDIDDPNGNFVFVRVYGEEPGMIAETSRRGYTHLEDVKALMKHSPLRFPKGKDEITEVVWLEDRPYIKIVLPILNSNGDPAAYIEGVFSVSQKAIKTIRRRAMVTVLWVIAIIFVTTALLFPTIIMQTRRLRALAINLLDSNLETLKVLGSAVAKRDSDTDAHNYRVTIYAVRLAEAIGMDRGTIRSLIKGAFLHDVGKIGIRDDVLLKPARLTQKEFEIIKTHVPHGLDIVKRSAWLSDAIDVVGHHHEKFDGTGYDSGFDREEIPITARVFAVADVFDALISRRPYKEPLPLKETMAILKEGRGTHFDPEILDAFSRIAEPLYEEFAGREDDSLKEQLEKITRNYFAEDIEIGI